MKKVFFLSSVIFVFLILSCSGLLWNDQTVESDNILTLTISNPFGNNSTNISNRAMALQGQFLFIEIARIDNEATYSDPVSPFTTDGIWEETEWGGRAILTFDLSDLGSIIATFENVPRDNDLMIRVILEDSLSTFESELSAYGESRPVCQTYNENGTGIWGDFGVSISTAELNSGNISLPIRPDSTDILLTAINLSTKPSEEYVDSSVPSYLNTEPQPGYTKFSTIRLNLNSAGNYLTDAAVYVNSSFNISSKGSIALYDESGIISGDSGGSSSRSFYIAYPNIDAVYYSDDIFIGSTIYPSLELTLNDYSGGSYIVNYGVLYDSSASALSGTVSWSLPSGFLDGDLEFSVIHIADTSPVIQDIDSIAKIYGSGFIIDMDTEWNQSVLSANTYNNALLNTTDGSWVVVFARVSNGSPFIFARYNLGP